MNKKIGLGIHDFKDLIENDYYYVDKTMLIHELLTIGAAVTLIPRPRRFGKTLNMTMLKYFFEKQFDGSSNAHLFNGLAISQYSEVMLKQGLSPVIFITFRKIKSTTWQECYEKLAMIIAEEFQRHEYVLSSNLLSEREKKIFISIRDKTMSASELTDALSNLSVCLYRFYGVRPIILIDEYDAPIHSGFSYGYYTEIINFMRELLCAGLKDNNTLAFAVLTGILRISRESIFSGMNNAAVYTLLSDAYADKFGFVESEVEQLLHDYNGHVNFNQVKQWYNGYRIGMPKVNEDGKQLFLTVYNPWSLINFIANKMTFGAYWINTSDNELIRSTMRKAKPEDKEKLKLLLEGYSVEQIIDDSIMFTNVDTNSSAMWSFLVFCGYLTWEQRTNMVNETVAQLIVPNNEVRKSLHMMIDMWFSDAGVSGQFATMLGALLRLNLDYFEEIFTETVIATLSFFDITNVQPERVYHAFMLGMMVSLADTYVVTSNLEAGLGRYDVVLTPKDQNKPGFIFEFKRKLKKDTTPLHEFAHNALKQINELRYDIHLRKNGVKKIAKIGVGFVGKEVAMAFDIVDYSH